MQALGLIAATALVFLASCSAGPQAPDQSPSHHEISDAPPKIDQANLFTQGESIKVAARVVDDSSGKPPSNDEVERSFPSAQASAQLPSGITVGDFIDGAPTQDDVDSMLKREGFAYDQQGKLTAGYSYVLVTSTVTNTLDKGVVYDASKGRFALSQDDGSYTPTGTPEPVYQSCRNIDSLKNAYMVKLEPKESKSVSTLYILPDDALSNPQLILIVGQGSGGPGGLSGQKAFAIGSIAKG